LWRNGIEAITADEIEACFDAAGDRYAPKLKTLYHINRGRPNQSRTGALDFINDARFAWAADDLAKRWWSETDRPAYRFVFDQPNPWQSSSRPHHGVDLVHLFAGLDLSHNRGAEHVGHRLRQSWCTFAHGAAPWPATDVYGFGPLGQCKSVSPEEYSQRRRTACFGHLRDMGLANVNAVFGRLAAGRISLLN
jgi:hypothetical protein